MKSVLNFIHSAIEVIVGILTLMVIDLPLKFISCIVITVAGIVVYVLYPITKKIPCPKWVKSWIEYSTSSETFLAWYIERMWH